MSARDDDVVERLRAARKYRDLAPQTLARVAAWATARHASMDAATKAAKAKLHQAFGAYAASNSAALRARVTALPDPRDDSAFRAGCLALLRMHASTRERIDALDSFYAAIFAVTGAPRSVLDLACGHQPFALPWMGLAADARYLPRDIDLALLDAVDAFLERVGRPRTAAPLDLLTDARDEPADVCLLLKALPCLERQEAGGALRVLRAIRAHWIVVSFPIESLGGRAKGMRGHYDATMEGLARALAVEPVRVSIPGELVFAWRRPAAV